MLCTVTTPSEDEGDSANCENDENEMRVGEENTGLESQGHPPEVVVECLGPMVGLVE